MHHAYPGAPNQQFIAGVPVISGVVKGKHYTCTTRELLVESTRIQQQVDLATMQSDAVIAELRENLRPHARSLYIISDAVARLDMICGFTKLSTTMNYVRPRISDSLVLRGARNPIVEIGKMDSYVPNKVYSGSDGLRFVIVTGGNMSGKSTYLKEIALIQILAQMGCFVPASDASISICDQIFTRLRTEDRPERNLGTHAVEMLEMNSILR